jgi:cation transport regulator ChaC
MGSLSKLPPEIARELRRHVSPRPLQQRSKQRPMEQRPGGNWVLAGTLVFTGMAFSIPFVAQQWIGHLNNREQPLTHAQIRRGAFLNSGSTDVGRDPQWDFRKGQFKKDDNYWAIFDNNAALQAFGRIVSATGKTEEVENATVVSKKDQQKPQQAKE